jgi:hypothetical protein
MSKLCAPPLRFLIIVLGAWIAGRVVVLSWEAGEVARPVVVAARVSKSVRPAGARITALDHPPPFGLSLSKPRPFFAARMKKDSPSTSSGRTVERASAGSTPPVAIPASPLTPRPPASPVQPPRPRSRWSLSTYAYVRSTTGDTPLASGGELGGSQVGARLTYRLNPTGPTCLALAARLSTPLASIRGAEGAIGVDWHPLPRLPLRLSLERRVNLGGAARDAWSAYAAGGFYRAGLPFGIEAEGYAQAGVVGVRRRDLFIDGALRAAKPIAVARTTLRLGVGVWGAAQPGVIRLDVGPRAALSVPAGDGTITAALEYRARIDGDANPGSGVAFTLSSDF